MSAPVQHVCPKCSAPVGDYCFESGGCHYDRIVLHDPYAYPKIGPATYLRDDEGVLWVTPESFTSWIPVGP